ncbi:hypothetical protein HUJ04_012414 [Dendroctonus ponderosae]|nr:hypothetical protein HUJ04_012414 [Dendroctonus ponderosae]KAH1029602.1 hypothetical protein HUJ05_002811 [Dendroctonus ponderosae]
MIPGKRDVTYINHQYVIEYLITVPYDDSIEELAHIIIIKNNLPLYVEKELKKDIKKFIEYKTAEYYEDTSTDVVQKAKDQQPDIDGIIKQWEKIMREVI